MTYINQDICNVLLQFTYKKTSQDYNQSIMNNINHQKQYSTTANTYKQNPSPSTHPPKYPKHCQCPLSINLKLKLINVSSENQVLKKKLAETEESLQKAKKFQHLFNKSVKALRKEQQLQSQQCKATQINKLLEMPKTKPSESSDQLSLTIKASQENQNFVSSPPTERDICQKIDEADSYKLDSYQYFKKLSTAQDKQTVKSLEFSFDSRSYSGNLPHLPLYNQEDFYALREEYEKALQNLEELSQKKINLLQQKIEQLVKSRQLLNKGGELENRSQRKQKGLGKQIFQADQFQVRQTAYFKPIEEQENQESEAEDEHLQRQEMNSLIQHFNFNESLSISSENWGDVAEQMRTLKAKLEYTSDFLRKFSQQLKNILSFCKNLQSSSRQFKVLPLGQYIKLIDSKKKQAIYLKKCQLLQAQKQELHRLLFQLTRADI